MPVRRLESRIRATSLTRSGSSLRPLPRPPAPRCRAAPLLPPAGGGVRRAALDRQSGSALAHAPNGFSPREDVYRQTYRWLHAGGAFEANLVHALRAVLRPAQGMPAEPSYWVLGVDSAARVNSAAMDNKVAQAEAREIRAYNWFLHGE